jgi:hypothetical protein
VSDLEPVDIVPLPEPEPAEPPRRRSSLAVVAVAIVALLGAGGFALAYLQPDANTPEDAVRSLVEAVADEDVLGALDALAPSERELLKDTVVDVAEELRRLDVLSEDADLSGIDGVDLSVSDLRLSAQELGEGVSLVSVRGTAAVRVEPGDLPVGSLVEEQQEGTPLEAGFSESTPIDDLQLVAVEEDGRWYVSLFYSLADAARRSAGEPVPDFAAGVSPEGASSPEEAVRSLVDAGIGLDARRVIALLPPDEAAALHDYAPLFLDDLEAEAAEARESFSVAVRSLDLSVDRDGDEAAVTVDGFDVEATVDGERQSVRYDGRCFQVSGDEGEEEETCGPAASALTGLLPIGGSLADADAPTGTAIVTVERDGRWYVSPIRTVLRPLVEALRAFDGESLEELFEGAWSPAPLDGESIELEGTPSDEEVQSDLRNGYTAFKVAQVDAGEWPTDPSELVSIEPSLLFVPWGGFVFPRAILFEVDGTDLRLAAKGGSGCFYLADVAGTVAYATDPDCGPPADQRYGPAW